MRKFYRHIIKPLIDFTAALILLLLASPVMLVVALLLYLTHHRPVLFTQERPGYREKIFRLYKFRTMTDRRDAKGELLPDADRLTSFGKFIRKTSLDELPQLINVLKGDMSMIGPRPLLVRYLPLYNEQQRRRHLVKPGITGWAQVKGRNAISWEEKFQWDVDYVDRIGPGIDLLIIWLTIRRVFSAKGINQAGEATVRPFTGNIARQDSSTN